MNYSNLVAITRVLSCYILSYILCSSYILLYLQAKVEIPLSETGVSQRFKTCNFCRCSLIICRPASPNCVAHKFKCLKAGNLINCSAQAEVTDVKAKLRYSRLPRALPFKRRATSASVARAGNVNRLGPPFRSYLNQKVNQNYYITQYTHKKYLF